MIEVTPERIIIRQNRDLQFSDFTTVCSDWSSADISWVLSKTGVSSINSVWFESSICVGTLKGKLLIVDPVPLRCERKRSCSILCLLNPIPLDRFQYAHFVMTKKANADNCQYNYRCRTIQQNLKSQF